MSPTDRIIDKLKKLNAMAEGAKAIGNETEATAFAEAFQRLLTHHKLNLSDVEFAKLGQEEPVADWPIDYNKYPDFETKRSAVQWESILATIIAEAHYCTIMRFAGTNRLIIVGRKSDAEVAEYSIITLLRAAGTIANREYGAFYRKCQAEDGTPRRARGFRDAFLLGFINRLKERYDRARNGDGTTTALVRIAREKQAVNDFMAAKKAAGDCKDLQTRKRWQMNEAGRRRGRAVADEVDIDGRAVNSGRTAGELA
jgi:hypothetical protein